MSTTGILIIIGVIVFIAAFVAAWIWNKALAVVLGVALLIALIVGAFFYGKSNADIKVEKTTNINQALTREIAELGVLEDSGTVTHQYKYEVEGDGFFSNLKNAFVKEEMSILCPYTAKYGVKMQDGDTLRVTFHGDTAVFIELPQPKMISYTMHLKGLQVFSKEGYAKFPSYQKLVDAEGEMEAEGIAQAQAKTSNSELCSARITKLLTGLYPGKQVVVYFYEPQARVIPIVQ